MLKRAFQVVFTVVLIGIFLFSLPMFFPIDTFATDSNIKPSAGLRQNNPNPDLSTDVYYQTEGVISGPPAPRLRSDDYPRLNLPSPFGESRVMIWILGQQHLYFGSFFLGVLFWIIALELGGLLARKIEATKRYDRLAYERGSGF